MLLLGRAMKQILFIPWIGSLCRFDVYAVVVLKLFVSLPPIRLRLLARHDALFTYLLVDCISASYSIPGPPLLKRSFFAAQQPFPLLTMLMEFKFKDTLARSCHFC